MNIYYFRDKETLCMQLWPHHTLSVFWTHVMCQSGTACVISTWTLCSEETETMFPMVQYLHYYSLQHLLYAWFAMSIFAGTYWQASWSYYARHGISPLSRTTCAYEKESVLSCKSAQQFQQPQAWITTNFRTDFARCFLYQLYKSTQLCSCSWFAAPEYAAVSTMATLL